MSESPGQRTLLIEESRRGLDLERLEGTPGDRDPQGNLRLLGAAGGDPVVLEPVAIPAAELPKQKSVHFTSSAVEGGPAGGRPLRTLNTGVQRILAVAR